MSILFPSGKLVVLSVEILFFYHHTAISYSIDLVSSAIVIFGSCCSHHVACSLSMHSIVASHDCTFRIIARLSTGERAFEQLDLRWTTAKSILVINSVAIIIAAAAVVVVQSECDNPATGDDCWLATAGCFGWVKNLFYFHFQSHSFQCPLKYFITKRSAFPATAWRLTVSRIRARISRACGQIWLTVRVKVFLSHYLSSATSFQNIRQWKIKVNRTFPFGYADCVYWLWRCFDHTN